MNNFISFLLFFLVSFDYVCYGGDKISSFKVGVPAKEVAVQQKLMEWMFASVMFVQSGRKQEQKSNIMYRGPADMSQHLTNNNLK